MLQEVPRSVWGYYSSPDVQPFSLSVDYSAFNVWVEETSQHDVLRLFHGNWDELEMMASLEAFRLGDIARYGNAAITQLGLE